LRKNAYLARLKWPGEIGAAELDVLNLLGRRHRLQIAPGELIFLNGNWYVTHTGLIALARRSRCIAIHSSPVRDFCDPVNSRWAFTATVYKTPSCKGFVGYGDADPNNVSPLVRGAEMRIAETRAVNRALRKAYGIGVCSVEELGIAR